MKLELKKLSDLEIGDRFYMKSQHGKKNIIFYTVMGKPEFNRQYGSPTRLCVRSGAVNLENKSCRMEVMKVTRKEVSK